MERLAVIMTVHNRRETTLSCLRALFSQTAALPFEVYLTDDGCTDGTKDAVCEEFPAVHILDGDGSLFWNRGMLMAWTSAAEKDYSYYLWLNDDTILANDALERLVLCSKKYSDNAVVIGTTFDSETGESITYGGRDSSSAFVYSEEEALPCKFMNGNIALIPRDVFQNVGFNDGRYSHGAGDYDYGLMALEKGFQLIVAPGKFGICDEHAQMPSWKNPSLKFSKRWKAFFSPTGANPFEYFYYRKKHFGIIPACLTFVTNFIHVAFPRLWKK